MRFHKVGKMTCNNVKYFAEDKFDFVAKLAGKLGTLVPKGKRLTLSLTREFSLVVLTYAA